ncbi:LlaJI family restriction endonuclease [Vibrio penaeicida]|uniref:LlaJI family restriction endonuclease n=1 Tax=Vibrio penaeicida TaxID=104609 RepID=UPI000CEA59D2|nr:LlaJI family restriction endonuclease [Vibrio penaeicida]
MPLSEINLYLDRTPLSSKKLSPSLIDALIRKRIIPQGSSKIEFCGVIACDEELAVFLPRNSVADKKRSKALTHLLIQALLKYYLDKDTGIHAQDSDSEVIGGESLSLAISLLEDYATNGLYVRRIRERAINKGKVDWRRTIASRVPLTSNDSPIYLELDTSRSRYDTSSEVAKIHAQVIKNLSSTYGLLWFGQNSYFDSSLSHVLQPNSSLDVQIACLEKELRQVYSDRDIFLLKGLIQCLKQQKGKKEDTLLIGVRKFHSLWEAMLDECLIGKYAVNSKLPVPVYQTGAGVFVPVPKKGQRTDTVLKHSDEHRFAIVDAKYYSAYSANSAPGWSDLVKQFYYHQAISQLEGKGTPVSNHFIFPGLVHHLQSAHVAKRGAKVAKESDCLPEYSTIHCHYQDPIELLKIYINGGKLTRLTQEIFSLN